MSASGTNQPRQPVLAAIQLNSGDSLDGNLETARTMLASAASNGVDCAILPENFAWMGREQNAWQHAEQEGHGVVQEFLSASAKELGIWICGGSHRFVVPGDTQHVTNTTLVFDPDGQQRARYDKIHLFDADVNDGTPYRESATIHPGDKLVVVDAGFARIGLTICYDLRFPELYQALRAMNAEIIIVPAAFTVPTGQAHWKPLLRARAIENQVYIIAAAQCGTHPAGRTTYGHSLCINPWGEVISDGGEAPGIIYCPFDAQKLHRIRHKMPVSTHHRPEVINQTPKF